MKTCYILRVRMTTRMEQKNRLSSRHLLTLLGITGFGQVGQYPVEIRAVDIGDNESEACNG